MMYLLYLDLAQALLAAVMLILPHLIAFPHTQTNLEVALECFIYLVVVYKLAYTVDSYKEQLVWAIKRNEPSEVNKLLDEGFDVNLKGFVLMCVNVLRSITFFSPSSANILDTTPLSYAVNLPLERVEIVQLLLAPGAEVHSADESLPLWLSCARGHKTTTELLLQQGADLNHFVRGKNSLMKAAAEGHEDAVSAILEHVVDGYRM